MYVRHSDAMSLSLNKQCQTVSKVMAVSAAVKDKLNCDLFKSNVYLRVDLYICNVSS